MSEKPCVLTIETACRLPSVANLSNEHYAARAHRVEEVHRAVLGALDASGRANSEFVPAALSHWRVKVRLWRLSPRPLDDDNLASALKPARDAVAKWFGLDDRDARVRFFCYQARGPTVVVPPTGRRRKARKLQTLRVHIQAVPFEEVVAGGASVDSLRAAAELAAMQLDEAERRQ